MTASSAYPPGSDQGPSEGRASEPSMEDILASIRRIIADDQQSAGPRAGARRAQPPIAATAPIETAPPVAPDRDEVLDLARFSSTQDAAPAEMVGHDLSAAHHASNGEPDMDHAVAHEAAREVAIQPPEAPPHDGGLEHFHAPDAYDGEEDRHDETLLAPPMSESVMSAFEALAATVVLENKPMLEGILRDLLRPMLKTWLDDNLPGLVERLVRVEIERVARGGRS